MRREGRQRGLVRMYEFLPFERITMASGRIIAETDPPATAGLLTRVPSKPTNHSKFTGKCCHRRPRCGGCRLHPVCKSKDKTKGNSRIKSTDPSHRMVTWRVVGGRPGMSLLGNSASGVLEHLVDYRSDDDDDHDEDPTATGLCIILGPDDEGQEPADLDACEYSNDDDEKSDVFEVDGVALDRAEEDDEWCLV